MTDQKKKILIVEDEESMRRALVDMVRVEGYAIFEAEDGVQALEVALRERPDLVLLDIVMPRMDGLTMLHTLREDAWGKTVPVIVLTNLDNTEDIAKAVESDIFEYFVKTDIKITEVIAKIKERLG